LKTLHHTGGSVVVDDDLAAAVLRYSLALAQHREMGAITVDDAQSPELRSQVTLVLGHGVPLAIDGVRSPEGILDRADTRDDIERLTEGLDTPFAPAGMADPDLSSDAAFDFDFDF
jgi:hypothetical protein